MADTNVQANVFTNQVLDPKSPVGIFELPCGYLDNKGELHTEIQVREMTGNEEDLLAAKKIKAAKKMNALMAACVERIGTITERDLINKAIPELLLGDRVFLLFAIRRVTYGDSYRVIEACPACEKESEHVVDLSTLDIKKMADPKVRSFTETLRSGKVVKFHAASGADEIAVADVVTAADDLSAPLLMRVERINDARVSLGIIKSLPGRDRDELRSLFEAKEGGVDTSVDFVCPIYTCENEFKKDLNVDAGFFFPSLARKR